MNVILQILFIVLLFPAYLGIKKAIENGFSNIPQYLHEQKIEEIKNNANLFLQERELKSTRELQIDNYYRSISGKNIETLFSNWLDILIDTERTSKLKQSELKKNVKRFDNLWF